MSAEIEIVHDRSRHRFVARVGDSAAVLDYRVLPEGTLDYYRTFTPVELRGRGIGRRLVEHALDYALGQQRRVRPTCPFVARAMERDPKYAALAVPPDENDGAP